MKLKLVVDTKSRDEIEQAIATLQLALEWVPADSGPNPAYFKYMTLAVSDETKAPNHWIDCIKAVRELLGAGLKTAKCDIVDHVRGTSVPYTINLTKLEGSNCQPVSAEAAVAFIQEVAAYGFKATFS